MSKNFELLRRLQKERELTDNDAPPGVPSALGFDVPRPVRREAELPDISVAPPPSSSELVQPKPGSFSRDGAFKLVQKVFLVSHQSAPRTVVFCGVEEDNGAGSIC